MYWEILTLITLVCNDCLYSGKYYFVFFYTYISPFSVRKQCYIRHRFLSAITSNPIKLNWENSFFLDQDFIRYSCFYVVANLILNTVRVKWVLLQSICEIDETLDRLNDFMFAIFAMSLQYFHSWQFCVSRVRVSSTLYII